MSAIPPSGGGIPITPSSNNTPTSTEALNAWKSLKGDISSLQNGELPPNTSLASIKTNISTVLQFMHSIPSGGNGAITTFEGRLGNAYDSLPKDPHYAEKSQYESAGNALALAQWPLS